MLQNKAISTKKNECSSTLVHPQPGCSHWEPLSNTEHSLSKDLSTVENKAVSPNYLRQQDEDITPGKILDCISPVPRSTEQVAVKKRGRALAQVLTSPAHIKLRKTQKRNVTKSKKITKDQMTLKQKNIDNKRSKKVREPLTSTSESEGYISLNDESDSLEEWNENICASCGENYNKTTKNDDWIQCITCSRWLHESCLKYQNMCDSCGKKAPTNSC